MTRVVGLILLVLWGYLVGRSAAAHEIRPAYLQIDQIAAESYDVVWRTPLLSGMRLPVTLALPEGTRVVGEPMLLTRADSLVERRRVEIPGGIEASASRWSDWRGRSRTRSCDCPSRMAGR